MTEPAGNWCLGKVFSQSQTQRCTEYGGIVVQKAQTIRQRQNLALTIGSDFAGMYVTGTRVMDACAKVPENCGGKAM